MGQLLLPHHLIAQEESILGNFQFFIKQLGLPCYGLTHIKWTEHLLHQGIFSLEEMTLIFPSGQLVDIPGNAIISPYDLNKEEKREVTLYVHLMQTTKQEEQRIELVEGEAKITFSINQLLLSTKKEVEFSKAVFKLAHFNKNPENKWTLSEDYIPPLLNLKPKLFLNEKIYKLQAILKQTQKKLEYELEQPEFIASQRFEAKLRLVEIAKTQRLLLNLDKQITLHPYYLYEQLSQLLDVLYINERECECIVYDHDNLAPLLNKLIQQIEQVLKHTSKDFVCLKFEKKESFYMIDSLPLSLSQASEIYFVLQKSASNVDLSLKGLKLTSPLRLPHIRQFALQGIPINLIKKSPLLNAGFSKESEVYVLEREQEWRHALSEGKLICFNQDQSAHFQAFLYWKDVYGTIKQIS